VPLPSLKVNVGVSYDAPSATVHSPFAIVPLM
jgi:hypothetical protein